MSATSPSANDPPGGLSSLSCLIIGIPESARVAGFLEAASAAPRPLSCTVASWRGVLEENGAAPAAAAAAAADVADAAGATVSAEGSNGGGPAAFPRLVRLESPGRNWPTERLLLELGAGEPDAGDPGGWFDRLTLPRLAEMSEPAGRIVAMRQWYLGWKKALSRLERQFPGAVFLNPPRDIAVLFDKAACQRRLVEGGCPVPPDLGIPQNADDLMEMMRRTGHRRVFLKACHGSSASAVAAVEFSPSAGIQAFSTVEIHSLRGRTLIFNRRPGAWARGWEAARPVLDAICRQRAQAQVWVPKAGWSGKTMDLRIITIAGRARHTAVRLSRTPLTNLQLRNIRGDAAAFATEKPAWIRAARRAAEQAAACFPDCLTLGTDVAVSPDGRARVLEVNAFGDHLAGSLHEGLNPWAWQIRELPARLPRAGTANEGQRHSRPKNPGAF